MKCPSLQTPRAQPKAKAIVHQNLEAISAPVQEQIRMM